uniref:Uncharacterized protein n=1 Tax=Lotharella globosa TaxID=91324 RepID=A0A7S3Y8Q9_9EUKA|mmetsp:Transcript_20656/g.39871  ORF Transcript_20656/g.39871 Transcript_20656/m.39871 type:complete len:173 (-) Transcript_20656:236-754(-)
MDYLRDEHHYKGLDAEFLEYDMNLWGAIESRRRMKKLLAKAKLIKWKLDYHKWWDKASIYAAKQNTTVVEAYALPPGTTRNNPPPGPAKLSNDEIQGGNPEGGGTTKNGKTPDIHEDPFDDAHDKDSSHMEAKQMIERLLAIDEYLKREHNCNELEPDIDEMFDEIGDEYRI